MKMVIKFGQPFDISFKDVYAANCKYVKIIFN